MLTIKDLLHLNLDVVKPIGACGVKSQFLSDVTLVSDDKIPFFAHKYVLSASSPVFKTVLLNKSQSNPLIYLRGVIHQELESILQFIYLGEASFKAWRTCQQWRITDEIINLDIPAYNLVVMQGGLISKCISVRNARQLIRVRTVCGITPHQK